MAYQPPSSVNFTTGSEKLIIYVADQVPIFIPMILFSFFTVVLLAGYFSQMRTEARSMFTMWFAIAGFATAVLATVLNFIEGVVSIDILTVVYSIAFIGGIAFIIGRNRG